jgi:hypothetical protein
MPGVSGLEKVQGVPTRFLLANEPGLVVSGWLDGLPPTGGRVKGTALAVASTGFIAISSFDGTRRSKVMCLRSSLPYAGMSRIRFWGVGQAHPAGCFSARSCGRPEQL